MKRSVKCAAATGAALAVAILGWTILRAPTSTQASAAVRPRATSELATVGAHAGADATDAVAVLPAVVALPTPPPDLRSAPDPALVGAVAEFARLERSIGEKFAPPGWTPPAAATTPGTQRLPTLKPGAKPEAQLRDAIRWFDNLPREGDLTPAEFELSRAQLASGGLKLLERECRAGVCRLSFAYSPEDSRSLAQRLGNRDTASARPNSWSFNIVKGPERVESHIFMVRK